MIGRKIIRLFGGRMLVIALPIPLSLIGQYNNKMNGYHGSICASDFGLLVPPVSVQIVPV